MREGEGLRYYTIWRRPGSGRNRRLLKGYDMANEQERDQYIQARSCAKDILYLVSIETYNPLRLILPKIDQNPRFQPAPRPVLQAEFSTMQSRDSGRDGETQPCSAFAAASGVQSLEWP